MEDWPNNPASPKGRFGLTSARRRSSRKESGDPPGPEGRSKRGSSKPRSSFLTAAWARESSFVDALFLSEERPIKAVVLWETGVQTMAAPSSLLSVAKSRFIPRSSKVRDGQRSQGSSESKFVSDGPREGRHLRSLGRRARGRAQSKGLLKHSHQRAPVNQKRTPNLLASTRGGLERCRAELPRQRKWRPKTDVWSAGLSGHKPKAAGSNRAQRQRPENSQRP